MTISIDRPLRHMSWANQKVYAACATLPEEALEAYIVNPEWSARQILQHILSGADWFVYCLGMADWNDIPTPKTIADIPQLAQRLEGYDAQILSAVELEDELLTFKEGEREIKVLRSTLLSAAILHSSEHRAQLMDAIESKGFRALNLDEIDLWNFEYVERKMGRSKERG
jgi:uncharacterized damage-inducible protein DinB